MLFRSEEMLGNFKRESYFVASMGDELFHTLTIVPRAVDERAPGMTTTPPSPLRVIPRRQG